jgi:hypothetical protein
MHPHPSVVLTGDEIRSFRADIFMGFKRVYKGSFPNLEGLVKSGERQLLFLNAKYNAKVTKYDVIKAPRAIPIDEDDPTEGKLDIKNGKEITDEMYAKKQKIGDTSLNNYYGYQKVKYADGSPLIAEYDGEGNPVYVYKFINLHGDGMYATEYYGDGRPSIFNNGSEKNVKNIEGTIVSNEIPDQDIVNYYGGESVPLSEADVITATIQKESENVVSSQPSTSVEGAQVVSGKKKELFSPEKGIAQKSFRGKTLNFVDKILTKKETVVAMSNNRQTGVISIDTNAMFQKFRDKAWTKSAKQLDGSFATPLAENEFSSMDEWFTFALIHEVKHDTILKQEGETTGQYEDRINQAALADLRENYNLPAKTVSPEVKVEKNIQDIIYKSNLEPGEYEVIEINGKQRVIDKRSVPERVKRGFSKFYSFNLDEIAGERYGKKIIIPGFEDINLMMEQDTNDVYELSTGLKMPFVDGTQKQIKEDLERMFKEKNIRKALADNRKTDINDNLLTKIAPEGLPEIENNNQNNCG